MTEAGPAVMRLQARESPRLLLTLQAERKAWKDSSSESPEGTDPASIWTVNFWPPEPSDTPVPPYLWSQSPTANYIFHKNIKWQIPEINNSQVLHCDHSE